MSNVSASVGAPAQPQVSLIPPEFARRRTQAAARALALLVVLIGVAISMAGWFFATGLRALAESGLRDEQAAREELNVEIAQYSDVLAQQAHHQRAIDAQAWAGAFDVRWDSYLAAIGEVLPQDTNLTQVQITQDSPVSGRTLTSEGRNPLNVGLLTISGASTSPAGPYETALALEEISGFYDAQVVSIRLEPETNLGVPGWYFDITLMVSETALSHRTLIEEGEAE